MFLLIYFTSSTFYEATGYLNFNNSISIKIGIIDKKNGICWGSFNDSLIDNGWYKFSVEGKEGADSVLMGKCAGYLEGYLSHHRIYQSYIIVKEVYGFNRTTQYPKYALDFYSNNIKFIEESIESYQDSLYWRQVSIIYNIFLGLYESYNLNCPINEKLLKEELFIHSFVPDLSDILTINLYLPINSSLRARCTASIRLLPDFSDIFVSHNSWSDYRFAHSVFIDYYFPIPEFKSKRVSLSTMLGMIGSLDDFYMTDTGLIIFETSLVSADLKMLKEFINPKSLFTSFRSLLSTFISINGSDFSNNFLKHNSGTYNNDYYIIDFNKFERGVKPKKDLIWLVEQIPSKTEYKLDITENLTNNGFIASFNCPFLPELFEILKYPDHSKDPIYFYKYYENPRYLISARDLPNLNDYNKYLEFMRYNNYLRDKFSNLNPALSIASREDLLGHSPEGSFNAKSIRGSHFIPKMEVDIINSPTYDNLPYFNWNNFPNILHDGLPDLWNFTWLIHENKFNYNGCNLTYDNCIISNYCGWCGRSKKCLPGNENGPIFNEKCVNGWKSKYTNYNFYYYSFLGIFIIVIIGGLFLALYFKNE